MTIVNTIEARFVGDGSGLRRTIDELLQRMERVERAQGGLQREARETTAATTRQASAMDRLGREAQQTARQIDAVDGKTRTLGASLKAVHGAALGALAGFTGLAAGVLKAAEAYDTQILAERRLELAIQNTGKAVSAARIKELASELQQVTTFGDEATLKMAALLQTFGTTEDQLVALIPRVQDMAAFMGVDMATAAQAVGRAMTGQVGGLSRYGVALDDTTKELFKHADQAERVRILTEQLDQRFRGTAQEMATTGHGAWQQLNNDLGDVVETIGMLVNSPLGGFLRDVQQSVQDLNALLNITEQSFDNLAQIALRNAGKAIDQLNPFSPLLERMGLGGEQQAQRAIEFFDLGEAEEAKEAVKAVDAASTGLVGTFKLVTKATTESKEETDKAEKAARAHAAAMRRQAEEASAAAAALRDYEEMVAAAYEAGPQIPQHILDARNTAPGSPMPAVLGGFGGSVAPVSLGGLNAIPGTSDAERAAVAQRIEDRQAVEAVGIMSGGAPALVGAVAGGGAGLIASALMEGLQQVLGPLQQIAENLLGPFAELAAAVGAAASAGFMLATVAPLLGVFGAVLGPIIPIVAVLGGALAFLVMRTESFAEVQATLGVLFDKVVQAMEPFADALLQGKLMELFFNGLKFLAEVLIQIALVLAPLFGATSEQLVAMVEGLAAVRELSFIDARAEASATDDFVSGMGDVSTTMRDFNASFERTLTNVPTGFKVAGAEFASADAAGRNPIVHGGSGRTTTVIIENFLSSGSMDTDLERMRNTARNGHPFRTGSPRANRRRTN